MKLRGGMQSIPLVRFSLLAVILASLLSSCVVGTERIGRPIIDEEVAMIRDGETTAPQILRLLGAPDLQSNLAGDLLYVYSDVTFFNNQNGTIYLTISCLPHASCHAVNSDGLIR